MEATETVNEIKESQSDRFAIIVISNAVFPERFIIAYREEKLLRELVAAPSIIGVGFRSRQAAMAAVSNTTSTEPDSKSRPGQCEVPRQDTHEKSRSRLVRQSIGLAEAHRIASVTLQHAIAAAVLLFYSRSVLGTVIRTVVGA